MTSPWTVYASTNQDEISSAALNNRQFSAAPPTHLSRALYIPYHDSNASSLLVYDTSSQYTAATCGVPIGSSQYVVALGLMPKPCPSSEPLAYEVHFRRSADVNGTVVGSILRQPFPYISGFAPTDELEVTIMGTTNDDVAAVLTPRAGTHITSMSRGFPMSTWYPVPPLQTRDGTFKQPYFKFQIPSDQEEKQTTFFQWEIHPEHDGRMRYSLVRVPAWRQSTVPPSPLDIVAIYHHIGVGASLSLPYSEGVLLVSPGMNSRMEAMVMGSALGMLWHLRGLRGERQTSWRGSRFSEKPQFSSLKGLLGRNKPRT